MSVSGCRRFEPNVFNSTKCQNCYKVKETHSNLVSNCKMSRKTIAHGILYYAPRGIDFSTPEHSKKKWQRRFFTLYNDAILECRIDNNVESVPQLKMDMKKCIRVCCADSITNHPHSLFIAFDRMDTATNDQHPVICYVKADSHEEIRAWQNILSVFAQPVHTIPIRKSPHMQLIEQNEILQPDNRSESALSSSSSIEQKQIINEANYIPDSEDYDIADEFNQEDMKLEETQQLEIETHSNDYQLPIKSSMTTPFQIDTNIHTLRKGWLMLRGKSDNKWYKHWVVLAGLNLKLFNDVWVDDNAEPMMTIDLSECENVYPSAATKNYGIEIKCKKARYILSAMTPGIRDSWIHALQQNLHNPSPTYPDNVADALSQTDSADILSITRRKKHIGFVAPESHHSNSLMDGFSSSTEADDASSSIRPTVDIPDSVIAAPINVYSENASLNSSADERSTNLRLPNRATTPNHQRRRSTNTNRQLSLSPSMRRSPVNRLKERRRGNATQQVSELSQPISSSSYVHSRRPVHLQDSDFSTQHLSTSSSLQQQVQELRSQLCETKSRLSEVSSENDRLRTLFTSQDLTSLRRCLNAAEENLVRHQSEMEILEKQFDTATTSNSSMARLGDHQNLDVFPLEISQRLVALLKIQIGVLSKVLHSSPATSFINLRQYVDNLIRIVASLDENTPQNMNLMQDAFLEVIAAFENLSSILKSTRIDGSINVDQQNSENMKLLDEIKDLEIEIEQIQNSHGLEMRNQRDEFEKQLQLIRERVESECREKNKLHDELQSLRSTDSNQERHMKEAIAELQRQFDEHYKQLQQQHEDELNEEKEATKLALDVLQRSHREELQKIKAKKECRCQEDAKIAFPISSAENPRQKEVIEVMSAELSNLNALYSAKCKEHSQLDERFKSLMEDKEKEQSKLQLENSRLRSDLQNKDISYEQLRKRLDYLEQKLKESSTAVYPPAVMPRSESMTIEQVVRFRNPTNGPASRKVSSNRRTDTRYHSNPMIPYTPPDHHSDVPFNKFQLESDNKTCLSVLERRRFFEGHF